MESTIETVMSFTNCTRQEAEDALAAHKGDVLIALDALFQKPVVSGEKHIPPPPKVDTGQDEEQKARCAAGRDLMDKLTFVFSGAHRKSLEQPPQASEAPAVSEAVQALPPAPPTTSPQQGSPVQTTQPYPQSEGPQ